MFSLLSSADFLCHSFSSCDWFAASSHEFYENQQLDHEIKINFPLFEKRCPQLFHKSNGQLFLWVYRRNKPASGVRVEKLVYLSVQQLVIYKFFWCSPNIPRGYCAGKPIERE